MGAAKGLNLNDYLPFREAGIRNLAATHQRGLGVQYARFTKAAAGTEAVTFGALNDPGGNRLADMANASYTVIIENETTAVVATAVAGTKTAAGFSVPGALNDVLNLVVLGQIADMAPP